MSISHELAEDHMTHDDDDEIPIYILLRVYLLRCGRAPDVLSIYLGKAIQGYPVALWL